MLLAGVGKFQRLLLAYTQEKDPIIILYMIYITTKKEEEQYILYVLTRNVIQALGPLIQLNMFN
jgi:hypothetical protein